MFFLSVKNLIQRNKEHRLYVTEVSYSRNEQPKDLYIFLTDYNTEVRCVIDRCLQKKHIRSRNETLYLLQLQNRESLLLFIDHVRGNDYILCRQAVYDYICSSIPYQAMSEIAATSTELVPAEQLQHLEFDPVTTANKVILADSHTIFHYPDLIAQLLRNNEVIISPYFETDIIAIGHEQHALDHAYSILSIINKLQIEFPGQLQCDLYVDPNQYPYIDPTSETDYLYALARQQDLMPSQVIFLTADETFTTRMKSNAFDSFHYEPKASEQVSATLPPRSERIRNDKRRLWQGMSRVTHFFY